MFTWWKITGIYLIFNTVAMPVYCVYVHYVAHCHDMPVNLITNFHAQVKVTVNITIDGYTKTNIKGTLLLRTTSLFCMKQKEQSLHLFHNQGHQNHLSL